MSNEMNAKDVVKRYIIDDIALYSIWMPGDISTSAIAVTETDSFQTFDYIIKKDDSALVCIEYLINAGAPVFKTTKLQSVYTAELENQLRRGLSPTGARDVALRKTRPFEATTR